MTPTNLLQAIRSMPPEIKEQAYRMEHPDGILDGEIWAKNLVETDMLGISTIAFLISAMIPGHDQLPKDYNDWRDLANSLCDTQKWGLDHQGVFMEAYKHGFKSGANFIKNRITG